MSRAPNSLDMHPLLPFWIREARLIIGTLPSQSLLAPRKLHVHCVP